MQRVCYSYQISIKLNVVDRFSKNTQILNFIKICPEGAKFYVWTDRHTDRRKDYRYDEEDRRFSQFCERA
jgi:hypothetical protein